MRKISRTKRDKNYFFIEKIFFELESGCIYTLENIFLEDKCIVIKRRIKEITKIPIKNQKLFAGKYEMKSSSKLILYPISLETILKVYTPY